MDRNVRIAKELVKVARMVLSEAVADKDGEYSNFTGKIDLGQGASKAEVRNATFKI